MTKEGDLLEEYESLKASPSLSGWMTELERILLGQREYAIRGLNSVEQYIKVTLAESSDWAKARATFKEALNLTVRMWQSTDPSWGDNITHLLDLIAAYTPPQGESKLLDYLRSLNRFKLPQLSSQLQDELRLKALVTMERYYHLVPIFYENEPAYIAYRQLLDECAEIDQCDVIRVYAKQRLKEIAQCEVHLMVEDTKEKAEEVIEAVTRVATAWS